MQICVSDMGYAYVSAMINVSEFPKALKMFAKELRVPEAITADSHQCNKSKEVKLGMTLWIIEGSTQRANSVELYVGL